MALLLSGPGAVSCVAFSAGPRSHQFVAVGGGGKHGSKTGKAGGGAVRVFKVYCNPTPTAKAEVSAIDAPPLPPPASRLPLHLGLRHSTTCPSTTCGE